MKIELNSLRNMVEGWSCGEPGINDNLLWKYTKCIKGEASHYVLSCINQKIYESLEIPQIIKPCMESKYVVNLDSCHPIQRLQLRFFVFLSIM